MIDLSKIRVGDEVTVKHIVRRVDKGDGSLTVFVDAKSWIREDEIATHTPKPREFKQGDPVVWRHSETKYEFIAEKDGRAALWFKNDDEGYFRTTSVAISDLRHAEESE